MTDGFDALDSFINEFDFGFTDTATAFLFTVVEPINGSTKVHNKIPKDTAALFITRCVSSTFGEEASWGPQLPLEKPSMQLRIGLVGSAIIWSGSVLSQVHFRILILNQCRWSEHRMCICCSHGRSSPSLLSI